MEPKVNEHQCDHQAGLGFGGVSVSAEARVAFQKDFLPASEIVGLAIGIAKISADVFDMITAAAEHIQQMSSGHESESMGSLGRQGQMVSLLKIVKATDAAGTRLQDLDSLTFTVRPEILELFLEDCGAVLATLREVSGDFAKIMGVDGSIRSLESAAGVLSQTIERLETCSEMIAGFPGAGLAASSQCLVETALKLQSGARNLEEQSSSHP